MSPRKKLYVGLDAGGSKTELVAGYSLQERGATHTGPAANLQRQGLNETAHVLADLIHQAMEQQRDAMLHAVCAGVAGAGIPDDQQTLAEAVRRHLGDDAPQRMLIVHDAAIALEGAFEGGSGVIVIVGTGSVAFARTRDGHLLRVGGWGYLLGDEGSGHVLGIEGLRAVAHAFDGGPATHLQRLLAEQHGIETPEALVHSVYRNNWRVQQMAPLVVQAAAEGDAVAEHIVQEQTQALARQVQWLTHPSKNIAPRVALLGGLSQSAYYRTALGHALRTELPGWLLQKPVYPPVVGALRLAMAAS